MLVLSPNVSKIYLHYQSVYQSVSYLLVPIGPVPHAPCLPKPLHVRTMLFASFFKTLVGKQITVELKNDLAIVGTLHSVDQVRRRRACAVRELALSVRTPGAVPEHQA